VNGFLFLSNPLKALHDQELMNKDSSFVTIYDLLLIWIQINISVEELEHQ